MLAALFCCGSSINTGKNVYINEIFIAVDFNCLYK